MKLIPMWVLLLAACDGDVQEPPPPPSSLNVELIASGLSSPVYVTTPANDQRLFVVEQPGRIRIIQNGQVLATPFLDIRSRVGCCGERGLLGLAFHPNYASNGWFFVNFTDLNGDTRVERYRVSADANVADPASMRLIFFQAQPFSNHNGGNIAFGRDGKLYIGMGDGGSGGDPLNHGQDRTTALGDLLRIDVDADNPNVPYAIPPDNPYATSTQFRREIWASGLRNPWRFSFDPESQMLYVADVGQNEWEEINAVRDNAAGVNYGWNIMEGAHCYNTMTCNQAGLRLPVHEYNHNEGCSVTGGYVYRGSRIPGIVGHYFYADYCEGWVKSFRLAGGVAVDHRTWSFPGLSDITSFGIDANRELYIVSGAGRIYRIIP